MLKPYSVEYLNLLWARIKVYFLNHANRCPEAVATETVVEAFIMMYSTVGFPEEIYM